MSVLYLACIARCKTDGENGKCTKYGAVQPHGSMITDENRQLHSLRTASAQVNEPPRDFRLPQEASSGFEREIYRQ